MKTLRARLTAICTITLLLGTSVYMLREREASHLAQFRYEYAIRLYASQNPAERLSALQLLNDLPNPQQAIALIGRRLADANLHNRLYAIHCLERMLGPVVALPPDAVRDASGATMMSNAATDDYVQRWQAWFEANYPNA